MVLVTGLEPVRELPRRILSPLRLPIPPHELVSRLGAHLLYHPDLHMSNNIFVGSDYSNQDSSSVIRIANTALFSFLSGIYQ